MASLASQGSAKMPRGLPRGASPLPQKTCPQRRFFNGAHEFPESERNFAYQWLKKHLDLWTTEKPTKRRRVRQPGNHKK